MRVFTFLLAGSVLVLFLTAVYAPRPSVANRAVAYAAHPIASIGDIFRRY